MSNKSNSSSGIVFARLLTIAFIVLKLTHYINWSWWWILSPIWITEVLATLVILLLVAVAVFK
jgi:hypothetical protein